MTIFIRATAVEIENDARLDALEALAGVSANADHGDIVTSASGATWSFKSSVVSTFIRTLLDDTTAAAARATLGLAIGSDVQGWDAELAAIAALTSAANKLPYFTGSGTASLADLTAFARTLLDDADAATMRSTLGLGALALLGSINNANWSGTALALANGGTGATTQAAAQSNLGLVPGTNVQAFSSILQALVSGAVWTAGTQVPVFTAAGTVAMRTVGQASGNLLDKTAGDALYAPASGGSSAPVATRTALAAIVGPANNDIRFLSEAGREGWFRFSTSNLSTQVTNDPGQGVYVPPAAATTGSSGAWVRIWTDRLVGTWFGATGNGTTNDLTAVQRAINYALFIGGAEVFYPIGVYNFGSSGVLFPLYNGSQWKTVKITGAGCVQEFGTALTFTMPTTGTMFITTATAGAAFSVAAGSGSYAPFSGYCIYLEDFTVRCPNNPSSSGVDMGNALQCVARNVEIDTGVYSNDVTAWTTTTSAGFITPANNNAALTELYNVAVSGFYKGIVMNEHANVIGGNVTGCANALWYEFGNHSSWYQGKLQNNVQNFVVNGACVFSAYVNIEHAASGAQVTTADIKDVGSLCVKAEIHWSIVKALVGQDTAFLRTGGNNIIDQRFGTTISTPVSVYRLAANQSIPNSTDTAITFAKSSGGGETSLHAGDATKIDINTSGTYRVSFIGAWAANGTGDRVIAINHQHGAIDIVAKAAQPAASASNETCQSCISTAIPYSGGAGEYLQALVNQASGGALNLLGGVNRSGVLTIEKLA